MTWKIWAMKVQTSSKTRQIWKLWEKYFSKYFHKTQFWFFNFKKSESALNVLKALKKRNIQSMSNSADSLELLRENLQYFFNDKIHVLVKDFLQTFFDPAIKNIQENTNETITEQQVIWNKLSLSWFMANLHFVTSRNILLAGWKIFRCSIFFTSTIFPPKSFSTFHFSSQIHQICRNLLESCAKSQYSSAIDSMSSPSSSMSRNTPDMNTSDSDTSENGATSLLHQALKRKRTESETEQLFKRQFFLTTAPPNHYFNTTVTNIAQQNAGKSIFRPTTSLLNSPKFITRPLQSQGIFTQSGSTTRPIFHIIQAPNRNLKLSATHVELCQLLQQNSNASISSIPITSASPSPGTTIQAISTSKESDSKN